MSTNRSVPQRRRSNGSLVPLQQNSPVRPASRMHAYRDRRFVERQRAQALGYELPLDTKEAAAFLGFHPKYVEKMARLGIIPAHPVRGPRRNRWRYYASELDAWLRSSVDSPRRPCSPDGKDDIN